MAGSMIVLYLISIGVVWLFGKKRDRRGRTAERRNRRDLCRKLL